MANPGQVSTLAFFPVDKSEVDGNGELPDVTTDAKNRLKAYPDSYTEMMLRTDLVIYTTKDCFLN